MGRVAWTPSGHHALVARAESDLEHCLGVIAVGGDGTIHHLIQKRPKVPVAALAAGTENLFAREFAMPTSPRRLASLVVSAHSRWVDLGLAGGRSFVLMAGFGFEAEVITRHHQTRWHWSRPPHRVSYLLPVLWSAWSYRFPQVVVEIEETGGPGEAPERIEGAMALFMNTPRYALGLPLAPAALADDGVLNLVVFQGQGVWSMARALWWYLQGKHLGQTSVITRTVRRARVSSRGPWGIPAQLDGDPAGKLGPNEQWEISVVPRALRVASRPGPSE